MSERIRPKASGYSEAGASRNRRALKGFTARSSSPNEDINWNNFTLRQRGRMLAMSFVIGMSGVSSVGSVNSKTAGVKNKINETIGVVGRIPSR